MTIVGRGPSLLRLTPSDFVPGPVITINMAIFRVRLLGLTNPIYRMHKDGCNAPHTSKANVPLPCVCPKPWMPAPLRDETLLLSAAESPGCFPDHPLRHVIDVEQEYGLPWWSMSAPIAVRYAHRMGAHHIRLLAFDARNGDTRRVEGRRVVPGTPTGYLKAIDQVREWIGRTGVDVRFIDPVSSA